jgi:hypothetical protein
VSEKRNREIAARAIDAVGVDPEIVLYAIPRFAARDGNVCSSGEEVMLFPIWR